jgi:hypothetical protein
MAPQTNATSELKANHFGDSGVSPAIPSEASPAARTAAVAESAPTTSSLEEASRANTRVGKINVYSPVTTGTWAIEV